MTESRISRILMTGCAFAVGLTVTACGDNGNRTSSTEPAAGTAGTAAENRSGSNAAPITVTGCLQKGSGMMSSYILTQPTRESGSVGTTGTAASGKSNDPNAVERQQSEAASNSYRLSGDNGQLGDLVGHKIRVTGTMTDRGDVDKGAATDHGTSGSASDQRTEPNRGSDRSEVKEGDLAKLEASSVESIADTCGDASSTSKSGSGQPPRTKQ